MSFYGLVDTKIRMLTLKNYFQFKDLLKNTKWQEQRQIKKNSLAVAFTLEYLRCGQKYLL